MTQDAADILKISCSCWSPRTSSRLSSLCSSLITCLSGISLRFAYSQQQGWSCMAMQSVLHLRDQQKSEKTGSHHRHPIHCYSYFLQNKIHTNIFFFPPLTCGQNFSLLFSYVKSYFHLPHEYLSPKSGQPMAGVSALECNAVFASLLSKICLWDTELPTPPFLVLSYY